jgi:hypothetical protein
LVFIHLLHSFDFDFASFIDLFDYLFSGFDIVNKSNSDTMNCSKDLIICKSCKNLARERSEQEISWLSKGLMTEIKRQEKLIVVFC